jgi:HTH-type transcriptional regulator, global nitrogen regulator NrpRI
MEDWIERKRLAILRILKDSGSPISSERLTEILTLQGYNIAERTVRLHLAQLDKEGMTHAIAKQGRQITEKGIAEMSRAHIYERLGFLTSKIHQMTYAMSFDLATLSGKVVVNTSLIPLAELEGAIPLMSRVFEKGYAMGRLVCLFAPGEQVGDIAIPEGYVGIGTVCSVTINGILFKAGIPAISRFGGLLEVVDGEPKRFAALINYDGTTIDPLEMFIKSGMTDYIGATSTGNGLIGASFREVPSAAADTIDKLSRYLDSIDMHGIMSIGKPDMSLCEVPVATGSIGLILIGGLNPVAILEESGIRIDSFALSGLVEFGRLFPYTELKERAKRLPV